MDGAMADAVREGLRRGLARFIAPARLPDGFAPAFAEAPGGRLFDLAANAAAAEALAHPLLGGGEGATDLLLALADGDEPPPRALGPARLTVEDASPRRFRIATPHHLFTGDLRRGELQQRLHGQDGPPALLHGGNLVEFTWRGRRHCLDVEDAIEDAGIEPAGPGLRLFHESAVAGRGRFSRGAPRPLARLRYTYEIRPDSPALALTVTLAPLPGIVLERVRITTACDAMSPGAGVDYGAVLLGAPPEQRRLPGPAGENVTVQSGPVPAYGAAQDRTPSRALRLHIAPQGPAPLLSVKASAPAERRLHWLLTRYAAERATAEAPATAREERLLLHGRASPAAAPRGADAAQAAPARRIAAALAAQALCAPPARAPRLEAAARRLLAALDPAETAPAELAFALMTAEALALASGAPADRAALAPLAARLCATQRDGAFREDAATPPRLADHAAALLALARALAWGIDAAGPLRRGIAALRLVTLPGPRDGIEVPGAPALTVEDLALLLRALRAAQAAAVAGALALPEEEARRLGLLADLALRFLQARLRPDGDALLAEGGPAAQAAALAALVPPEGALRRRPAGRPPHDVPA